jgi:hypothetical protein
MRRYPLATTAWLIAISASLYASYAQAEDLIWQVESPFRFFRSTASFALQEAAFDAARGDRSKPLPANIIWRTERRLDDPDCKNASTPDSCAATAGPRYEQSRLGWAARTLNDTCYDRNGHPPHYDVVCQRRYSWGRANEDYVLPAAHTVTIRIARGELAGVSGNCVWTWQPRAPGGRSQSRTLPCNKKLTIARVPYSLDRARSGVSVAVKLPNGRELVDRNVVVEDLFIVALGDSFASGEGNPDRPVQFSASRAMVYDPTLLRDETAMMTTKRPAGATPKHGTYETASSGYDPKVLPRRYLEDEAKGRFDKLDSPEFRAAFHEARARWLSPDCHRSQYGYPFRVGIELALENRHRSVTLASLTCSGAEIADGLFLPMDAREGSGDPRSAKVRPQFDQLADLICRGGAAARTQSASYTLPVWAAGSTQIELRTIGKRWCPPQLRKRPINLVLMSIGGNDVGFGQLAAYAMTKSAGDLAPIAAWVGRKIRFGPQVSRVYLEALDERMQALKKALNDGFGVKPGRVIQSSYEPIQFDQTGALCGMIPTLGMDVHPGLRLSQQRLKETVDFLNDLLARLECITHAAGHHCPAGLATGTGTGFTLVTDHIPEFRRRGMCAADPKRASTDMALMGMPRPVPNGDGFKPFSPAATLPYEHRWRLFRTPNDAFLTANTHSEGTTLFDILQPVYAALYSGAVHPTAEAHAIVADHVIRHVRSVLERQKLTWSKPDKPGQRRESMR